MKCIACGEASPALMFIAGDQRGQPVPMYRCMRCAAIFAERHDDISTHENTRRQAEFHAALWRETNREEMDRVAEDMRGVVRFYRDYLGAPGDGKVILEIGAGRGSLLEALRREGYAGCGCEPARELVSLARARYGLGADRLQCEDVEVFLGRFRASGADAIFLWHVIEHMADPIDLLRRLGAVLRPGGALILQAPLPTAKQTYPEHLFFVTPETVAAMAELSGLKLTFCDPSFSDLFVSFVLAHPDSRRPTIEVPRSKDVAEANGGLLRLFDAAASAMSEANLAQKRLIDERDRSIRALQERNEDLESTLRAIKASPLGRLCARLAAVDLTAV
jgi:2-polyprenyl-3-methyl-5-hydroxy-6-metoxy-1,4-benzoquinol methylase